MKETRLPPEQKSSAKLFEAFDDWKLLIRKEHNANFVSSIYQKLLQDDR